MKLFGSSRGGGAMPPSLFTRSVDGFATMAALIATIFAVPVLWADVEARAAALLLDLYGREIAVVMFWTLKIGVYPLVFFAIRMSLATTFATLAIGLALRFL